MKDEKLSLFSDLSSKKTSVCDSSNNFFQNYKFHPEKRLQRILSIASSEKIYRLSVIIVSHEVDEFSPLLKEIHILHGNFNIKEDIRMLFPDSSSPSVLNTEGDLIVESNQSSPLFFWKLCN